MVDRNRRHITIGQILRLPPLLFAGLCAVAAQSTSGPLPAPTGAWPIGRTSVQLIDSNRKGRDGVQSRLLMLHIWYPASLPATRTALPYIERLEKAGPALSDDERDLLKTVRTHAFNAPTGVPPTSRFPVLLLSHGEQMNGFLYSNLAEELTSHGYVVIAVDHPGAALFVAYQDGSVASYSDPGTDQRSRVAERAEDLRFVRGRISSLEVRGRRLAAIVSGRVGAIGHSSGGLAAAMLCQERPIVDACLNMDGRLDAAPIMTGASIPAPSRPFMYLTKPFRALTDEELKAEGMTREQSAAAQAETWARDRRLLASGRADSYRVTLHRATHESFSDEPLLRNPGDRGVVERAEIVRGLVLEFFDATIRSSTRKSIAPKSNSDIDLEVLAPVQ